MEQLSPRAMAKRRQITDAGRALFLSQGFTRTSMDAVTAEAGVSKQTLYAYFPSKDELLIAILAESLHVLGDQPDGHAPRTREELRAALVGSEQTDPTTRRSGRSGSSSLDSLLHGVPRAAAGTFAEPFRAFI